MKNNKLNSADFEIMKNFVSVVEGGRDPYKYIENLSLRQKKILMAAITMGKAEGTFETEQEWLRRQQHNFLFPENPIPEPDQRKGDMGALFSSWLEYSESHGLEIERELDGKRWQNISDCIRTTLIILLGREAGSII